MNIEAEKHIVAKVEELIRIGSFTQICFEIGKFIEGNLKEIYFASNNSYPRTAKAAIDFVIEKKLVYQPLGYKLHVIRELRNIEAHNLNYLITLADAKLAVATLNEFIEWLHQGNLAREWSIIAQEYAEGEELLSSNPTTDMEIREAIFLMYTALHSALEIKIRSMGLTRERRDFFSAIQLLASHGIDVRSHAWRKLTEIRNRMAHSSSDDPSPREMIISLAPIISELHDTLTLLSPLNESIEGSANYPQVVLGFE